MGWFLNIFIFLFFFNIILWLYMIYQKNQSLNESQSFLKPWMLVIAHPDDESMFFSPFLNYAKKWNIKVFILCLSEGIGDHRPQELLAAVHVLGFENVVVYGVDGDLVENIPKFEDGMKIEWDVKHIMKVVDFYRKKWMIGNMITFDEYGVSGHINHRFLCRGVRELAKYEGDEFRLYELDSTPLPWKYCFWNALVYYRFVLLDSKWVINLNYLKSLRAMAAHRSQFVWFRKIFIVLSCYSYFNVLKERKKAH